MKQKTIIEFCNFKQKEVTLQQEDITEIGSNKKWYTPPRCLDKDAVCCAKFDCMFARSGIGEKGKNNPFMN